MQDEDHCTIDGVVYAPVDAPCGGSSCAGCAGKSEVGGRILCHELPPCTRGVRHDSRDILWVRAE